MGCLLDLNFNASTERTERQRLCCPHGASACRTPTVCVCVFVGVHGCLDSYLHWDWWSSTLICLIFKYSACSSGWKTSKQINLYRADVTIYFFISTPKNIYVFRSKHFSLNLALLYFRWDFCSIPLICGLMHCIHTPICLFMLMNFWFCLNGFWKVNSQCSGLMF